MLIVINSPALGDIAMTTLAGLSPHDCVVLRGDGTYLATDVRLAALPAPLYIMNADVLTRGISVGNAQPVDEAALVTLSANHTPWITW